MAITDISFGLNHNASFWDHLTRPRPYILVILIALGLVFQINIHYFQNISAAYTQFFYVIIVFSGLWYQKKAIWIALFFSVLYLGMEFLPPGSLSLDSIFRALMLCLVAVIVGGITDRMKILQNGLSEQNTKLQESHKSLESGNKKLNMLSSITRHDILNQIMVLRTFLELSKDIEMDPVILGYMEKEDQAAKAIEDQITFTRYYQDIRIEAPAWQNVDGHIRSSAVELRLLIFLLTLHYQILKSMQTISFKKCFITSWRTRSVTVGKSPG